MPAKWPKPGPIRQVGPKLPKTEPGTEPYIKRQRKDVYPDESGDRAK